jgi:hypothetical protein
MSVSCRNAGMCVEHVVAAERALQEKGPLSLEARGHMSRFAATSSSPSSTAPRTDLAGDLSIDLFVVLSVRACLRVFPATTP